MNEFLSIGKVAKLKNVSIKSLRYYDDIGILKPAYVNGQTNYRYYTREQLYLLDAVDLCLQLGIPLKSLHNYVQDGTPNLKKLLDDGHSLAKRRIETIQDCLHKLSDTVAHMESALPQAMSAGRTLFTILLDEYASPKYYGQYILQLFVQAQQLQLTVGYPSGILYRNEKGSLRKYMYLHITDGAGEPLSEAAVRSWQHSNPEAAGRMLSLPASSCPRLLLKEHVEGDAFLSFSGIPGTQDGLILEGDIMDPGLKADGHQYELLLYQFSPGQY